jgi:hypothetical protein
MLNRRLAVVSGLAVLSAVAFAPKAGAQTVDINFSGTVTGTCAFSGTTNGSLGQYMPTAPFVEATNGTPIGNTGTTGTTTVNCTTGGQVTVAAPVKVAAPTGFTDTTKHAVVYDVATNVNTSATVGTPIWINGISTSPLTIPANTNRTLRVGMLVGVPGSTGGVPAGTYNYKVTLTATPN